MKFRTNLNYPSTKSSKNEISLSEFDFLSSLISSFKLVRT